MTVLTSLVLLISASLASTLSPVAWAGSVFSIQSPAFTNGRTIPTRYTADGDGVSPPLSWSDVPSGTAELALIVDDPDAPRGTYTHWVLYGISPHTRGLAQSSHDHAEQGVSSAGTIGYTPPSPPRGPVHHYRFTLYALDKKTALAPGLSADELRSKIAGHIRGDAELIGTYRR